MPAGAFNNNLYTQFTAAATAGVSESPAVTISPLEGAEFTRSLLGPVHLETLVLLAHMGWDIDRVMRLTVQEMNRVENVKRLIGEVTDPPRFEAFAELSRRLRDLQERGLLELAYEDVDKPLSEPTVVQELKPTDLTTAAQKKYKIHQGEGPHKETVVTLWGKERHPVLRIAPGAWADPAGAEVLHLLDLIPDQLTYRMVVGAETGQLKAPQAPGAEVVVSTRSALGVLLFVAKAVEVPAKHVEEGLVRDPVDEQGRPFDWARVMGDLIRVHSQKTKPKRAFVATKYRGWWFSIDDDDLASKSTFALVLTVCGLEFAGGVIPGPVLTVPVGAGISATPGAAAPGRGGGRGGGGGGGQTGGGSGGGSGG